jgi:hypothetical protein
MKIHWILLGVFLISFDYVWEITYGKEMEKDI